MADTEKPTRRSRKDFERSHDLLRPETIDEEAVRRLRDDYERSFVHKKQP